MFRVKVRIGRRTIRRYTFDKPVVTFGRGSDCDVVVESLRASRRHASIVHQGGDYLLQDERSHNGTFVNERKVARHELGETDSFTIGDYRIEFERLDVSVPVLGAEDEADPGDAGAEPPTTESIALNTITLAHLVRMDGEPGPEDLIPLAAPCVVVGRGDEAAVRLESRVAPRVACVLTYEDDTVRLLAVSRRVRVNGERVSEVLLSEGDEIRVGRERYRFVSGESRS